ISVGTKNSYGHPLPDVVRHLASCSTLACTQVTAACHGAVGAGTGGVPCGGTIGFRAYPDGVIREIGWDAPKPTVDAWDPPLCRDPRPSKALGPRVRKSVRGPRRKTAH